MPGEGLMEALTLLRGGSEAFPAILSAIESAKESILVHMFIWREDEIGKKVAEALLLAADRGVRVTVEKDRYGVVLEKAEESRLSFLHRRQTVTERLKARTLAALYAPEAGGWRREGESELYRRLASHKNVTLLADTFRADHSKFYIIDHKVLFLGGINIEDKECGSDLRGRVYGDYMVKGEGDALVAAFLAAWAGGDIAYGDLAFPHNRKETGRNLMEEHYLSLINSAKEELLIVMAYLSPLPRFLSAIKSAAARGVRVRVMIPQSANFQSDTNRRTVCRLLKESGGLCEIYLSQKMLHTKLILSEKEISLGSTNITKKAFRQLDELNLALPNDGGAFPEALLSDLEGELAAAQRVYDPESISYSPLRAFLEGLLV